uniref:Uncharacterized protein n=1 Tax=Meloidogyne hapla TaxID=6305 RepID=A0A1I8BQH6_MELHA
MIKFLIFFILYLNIYLNIKCNGKLIKVGIKIKDDWKEKREFIYLKNVELKERFVLKTKGKLQNRDDNILYNKIGTFHEVELNRDKNIFNAEISTESRYGRKLQLTSKILIEIANNEIIQNLLTKLEKQLLKSINEGNDNFSVE